MTTASPEWYLGVAGVGKQQWSSRASSSFIEANPIVLPTDFVLCSEEAIDHVKEKNFWKIFIIIF